MVELVWSGSGAATARSGSLYRRNRDEIAGPKAWRPSGHRFRGRNRLYVHPKDSVSTILGRCVPAPARQLLSNAAQQQALPWKKSVARHETPDPVPKRVIFPPLRGFLDPTGAAMPPPGLLASQTKLWELFNVPAYPCQSVSTAPSHRKPWGHLKTAPFSQPEMKEIVAEGQRSGSASAGRQRHALATLSRCFNRWSRGPVVAGVFPGAAAPRRRAAAFIAPRGASSTV